MRAALLTALVAAGATAGCAGGYAGPLSPALVWTLAIKEADGRRTAYLGYALPESDDIVLTLRCEHAVGRVSLAAPFARAYPGARFTGSRYVDDRGRPEPWTVEATLRSGSRSERVRGEVVVDEMRGGVWFEGFLDADAPGVWDAFARTGVLSLRLKGEDVTPPPAPKGDAAAFVKWCAIDERGGA